MADWPDVEELKQLLDITSEDWDGSDDESRLSRVLASAIATIKTTVAGTEALYEAHYTTGPTPNHAQAALRMGELIATRPEDGSNRSGRQFLLPLEDPTIRRLLYGSRRVFGVA